MLIIRLVLPYIILNYAIKTLKNVNGYFGHLDDLRLALYRVAYVINDFYLDKIDSSTKRRTPFISSQIIDLSVEWKSIFYGRLVRELEFINPLLRFTKDKMESTTIEKDTNYFQMILKTFIPLQINHFETFNGKIQYIDSTSSPKLNIAMTEAYVLALNLSNVINTAMLPTSVIANSNVYKGTFDLQVKMNLLEQHPTYDLNAELKNINLPELNVFFLKPTQILMYPQAH